MSPVSVAGTLVQVLAEVLSGIAYSQLLNPGAPIIFGAFVASIDMNSGAPTFGTPEASKILYGAGQLARRLGVPFRSGGALCGSKLPDSQAAYESANTLQAGLLGGVNALNVPAPPVAARFPCDGDARLPADIIVVARFPIEADPPPRALANA